MDIICRVFEFDAAHRVLGHESKCKHLHGHRYKVELVVQSGAPLDPLGRVVDFGDVKQVAGRWIDENLDHNAILHPNDPLLNHPVFSEKQPFVMPFPGRPNPTAENIAHLIFHKANDLLPANITSVRCRVWETPNCYADYSE